MSQERFKLESIEIKEEHKNKETEVIVKPFNIDDFNLLISDNAQGKTRFLRTLYFLSSLVSNRPRIIITLFSGKFTFIHETEKNKRIVYLIDIIPENGKNKYEEEIICDNKKIFSTKEKILINEKTNCKVESFFIPPNIPAISSINEPDYITINLINEFFSKIVYISSSKSREIIVSSPNAIIPNSEGTNIADVLFNWSKEFSDIYNETLNEFYKCFNLIENVDFVENVISGIKTKTLAFKEKSISKLIDQVNWSDGIYRILHLLMSVKVPFKKNQILIPPSLILIDEIENGLDFKRLEFIVNYLRGRGVIFSSHNPL
ncbi:MAG: AAA family ATPase [bacterium]